jgi:molybdate transport system substrate-binding protein
LKKSSVVAGFALLLVNSVHVEAAEVKVMAGSAIAPALNEVAQQFEQKTGHKVVIDYGIQDALKRKIDAGEAFDLAIIGEGSMDDAIKQGRIVRDTRTLVARVGMAVAARSGAPKPDISSVDAFKRALLNAKSITYPPKGAVGIHLAKVFDNLGIGEQMKDKIRPLQTVELVPQAVATGEAELGFAPSTVLKAGSGIDIVGSFPDQLQTYIVYVSAVGATAKQPDAALDFIKYLATPDAITVMKAKGFEPGTPK